MNRLITTAGQPATMSSREIAEMTGKRHDNVLRDIRTQILMVHFYDECMTYAQGSDRENLATYVSKASLVLFAKIVICKLSDDSSNLRTEDYGFTLVQEGSFIREILLDRENSYTLVSGYDVRSRSAIIKRWQELEAAQAPAPAELSRMDILKLAMESEEARIKAEEERDEAIRTKALIGSKREATAMATAAAKAKEVNRLKHELGRNQLHATVKAVKKMTGIEYDWRAMRKHCKEHGIDARNVVDEQYGSVKAWPAIAWMDVHGIDLAEIFHTAE